MQEADKTALEKTAAAYPPTANQAPLFSGHNINEFRVQKRRALSDESKVPAKVLMANELRLSNPRAKASSVK